MYLNTVLTEVFAIVFVFGNFIVFVFVSIFKYYAMYLDPRLIASYIAIHTCSKLAIYMFMAMARYS